MNLLKKIVTLSVLVSLAACSSNASNVSGGSNTSTTNSPPSTTATSTTSPVVATSESAPNIDVTQITFVSKDPSGVVDSVNDSAKTSQAVSKDATFKVNGWAFIREKASPATTVLITTDANKTLIAAVPVNLDRPDVAKALDNPGLQKSGWTAQISASNLPAPKNQIQAWAYDETTKKAYLLGNTYEITVNQ